MNVVQFPSPYTAKAFSVAVGNGRFKLSGTLCGCIDMAVPGGPTFVLTSDEAFALAQALLASRHDVLENSSPNHDPRLYDPQSERTGA